MAFIVERICEAAAGFLAVGLPALFLHKHSKLTPPIFQNAASMVTNNVIYMQDTSGKWWMVQPAKLSEVN
jgi:hypothetical protein